MFEYEGVKISWLGHDGFRISDDVVIYIDPFNISSVKKADVILLTHEHFDHLSLDDIRRITSTDTVIVAPSICESSLTGVKAKQVITISPGEKVDLPGGVTVEAIPAYNINKFRAPGKVFHPKEEGRVGYILNIKGVKIYHAGDTDFIPEMKNLKNISVALLPSGGTYTMDNSEAAEAALAIKPEVAIPMHRWSSSPEAFKRKVESSSDIKVVVLEPGEEYEIE